MIFKLASYKCVIDSDRFENLKTDFDFVSYDIISRLHRTCSLFKDLVWRYETIPDVMYRTDDLSNFKTAEIVL